MWGSKVQRFILTGGQFFRRILPVLPVFPKELGADPTVRAPQKAPPDTLRPTVELISTTSIQAM